MQQDASDALSNLDHAFLAAMEHNRALLESAANFMRDESFRFINLRMNRARDAVSQLSECRDMPGMMTVQKEWTGDLVHDMVAQGQRYSEFWQHGAERVRAEMARHAENAQQAAQVVMQEATASAETAAEAAHEAVYGAAEQTAQDFSEAQDALSQDAQPVNTYNNQHH